MRSFLSTLMFVSGCVLFALSLVLTPSASYAQPPRPTIVPTATPEPTETPQPAATPRPRNDKNDNDAAPLGRITGTVIDQTTGAPVSGITVLVGDMQVQTDANGNYERVDLPAGSYTVSLVLSAEQGVAAQEPLVVQLEAGANVVQHLAFASPQPAEEPAPEATPEPTPAPAELPRTGGESTAATLMLWAAFALMIGGFVLRKARAQ